MPTRTPLILSLLLVACGGGATPDPSAGAGDAPAAEAPRDVERPARRTDTLMVEGTPQPMELALFRAPDGFPLPFSAYVPADMAAETATKEDGSTIRFVAEFGGRRNDRAFIHLFVHPAGTDPQQALAVVRAYEAAGGIPVSRGIEPLGQSEAAARMAWADQAYTVRYQGADGWYLGSVGIGTRGGRVFHLLTHYPAEYADGFAPRTALVLETWRWAGGDRLVAGTGESDITIPSARPR